VYPENKYTYDPLYRIIEATGREKFDNSPFYEGLSTEDITFNNGTSPDAIQAYTRSFEYDPVGNILSQQHISSAGSFTKEFTYDETSNVLENVAIGGTDEYFTYDAHGNQLASSGINFT